MKQLDYQTRKTLAWIRQQAWYDKLWIELKGIARLPISVIRSLFKT